MMFELWSCVMWCHLMKRMESDSCGAFLGSTTTISKWIEPNRADVALGQWRGSFGRCSAMCIIEWGLTKIHSALTSFYSISNTKCTLHFGKLITKLATLHLQVSWQTDRKEWWWWCFRSTRLEILVVKKTTPFTSTKIAFEAAKMEEILKIHLYYYKECHWGGGDRTRVGRGSLFKLMLPCPDALTDL